MKKKRSACVEITVFLRITGAFFPPVMVLKWISSFISDFHKQSKVLRTLKPTTCMYFLQSAATTLCWPAATQVHMTAKTTQRHVSVWTKMLHVSQIFRGGFLTTFSNTFHHHVSVEEPQKRRDSLHSAASFFPVRLSIHKRLCNKSRCAFAKTFWRLHVVMLSCTTLQLHHKVKPSSGLTLPGSQYQFPSFFVVGWQLAELTQKLLDFLTEKWHLMPTCLLLRC